MILKIVHVTYIVRTMLESQQILRIRVLRNKRAVLKISVWCPSHIFPNEIDKKLITILSMKFLLFFEKNFRAAMTVGLKLIKKILTFFKDAPATRVESICCSPHLRKILVTTRRPGTKFYLEIQKKKHLDRLVWAIGQTESNSNANEASASESCLGSEVNQSTVTSNNDNFKRVLLIKKFNHFTYV